jgi:hypothetical protein
MTKKELETALLIGFKIQETPYAESTFKMQNYYFFYPKRYIELGENGIKGQGDRDEALFARIKKVRTNKLKKIRNQYGDELIEFDNGDFIDFKLKEALYYPTYCMYMVDAKFQSVSVLENKVIADPYHRIQEISIPQEFFNDFSGLDGNCNLGMLQFEDKAKFINCLCDGLRKIGYVDIEHKKNEYVNRSSGEWMCREAPEKAVFYKDKAFKHQEEYRIVVKDKKANLMNSDKPFYVNVESNRANCKFTPLNLTDELKVILSYQCIPI